MVRLKTNLNRKRGSSERGEERVAQAHGREEEQGGQGEAQAEIESEGPRHRRAPGFVVRRQRGDEVFGLHVVNR